MRLLPALTLTLTLAAAAAAGDARQLGRVDFPTSGGPEAREHFLRGVLYLHSFEYRDARDAFRAAQEAEPGFAMAWWGEAMTYNHPIWLEESYDEARAALERLGPTPEARAAKAPTEREKDYLGTVEVLFGDGDKRRRDDAYAEALRRLTEKYPDDLEAKSFHALAILGICHDGRDAAAYMRAAAVVEEVFDANPEHPGAAHYLIHSYDDPVHAPLGLRPARVYARIAPDAEHALHMPSHIFLALGMWEETVASNVDSWTAGERRVEREDLPPDRRGYHALSWLHYAYLQQGRFREARELLGVIRADAEKTGTVRARVHHAMMRGAYLVETEQWDAAPAGPDLTGLDVGAAAVDLFATGLAAIKTGKLDGARAALADLDARIAEIHAEDAQGEACHTTVTAGYTRTAGVRAGPAEATALELEGLIRLAEGRQDEALELLARAAEAESALSFGFGPPFPVKPSSELYGEVLLTLGRAADAGEQFERALARAPRRARSVLGLLRAARLAGDDEVAAKSAQELAEIWARADADVRRRNEAPAAP